jgi:predicted dehydrogenase
MKEINIGIIGGGFMCRAHANGYKTARYIFSDLGVRANLQAICMRSEEKAKVIAEKYGFASAYASVDALLAAGNIDLYDICVPAQSHKTIALDVITAGKTVLCEKPLALCPEDAREMYLAARSRGIDGYVGFNYRFMPAVMMARSMIAGEVLGSPRHMRVSYFQQNGADSGKFYENIRYVNTPGCGSLQEIGTHAIDQMRFLIGELQTVSAITTTFTPERQTISGERVKVTNEDMAAAIVTFDNGVTGVLECSGAYWGKKNQLSWEIFCSEGAMFWNLENPNYLGVYKKDCSKYTDGVSMVNVTGGDYPYGKYWWPGSHNLGWEHGTINMVAGVLENMAAGKHLQPVATFCDGYKTAVIVDAIRRSAKTGKRIDLFSKFEV